jgi:hypothetical protein
MPSLRIMYIMLNMVGGRIGAGFPVRARAADGGPYCERFNVSPRIDRDLDEFSVIDPALIQGLSRRPVPPYQVCSSPATGSPLSCFRIGIGAESTANPTDIN